MSQLSDSPKSGQRINDIYMAYLRHLLDIVLFVKRNCSIQYLLSVGHCPRNCIFRALYVNFLNNKWDLIAYLQLNPMHFVCDSLGARTQDPILKRDVLYLLS